MTRKPSSKAMTVLPPLKKDEISSESLLVDQQVKIARESHKDLLIRIKRDKEDRKKREIGRFTARKELQDKHDLEIKAEKEERETKIKNDRQKRKDDFKVQLH